MRSLLRIGYRVARGVWEHSCVRCAEIKSLSAYTEKYMCHVLPRLLLVRNASPRDRASPGHFRLRLQVLRTSGGPRAFAVMYRRTSCVPLPSRNHPRKDSLPREKVLKNENMEIIHSPVHVHRAKHIKRSLAGVWWLASRGRLKRTITQGVP